jgi:hypothetical protein
MVDDFCHSHLPRKRPGPNASLSDSEVITLAIFARWDRFRGERDFYRYARRRLLRGFGHLGDARSRREAQRRGMACWLRRHRVIQ